MAPILGGSFSGRVSCEKYALPEKLIPSSQMCAVPTRARSIFSIVIKLVPSTTSSKSPDRRVHQSRGSSRQSRRIGGGGGGEQESRQSRRIGGGGEQHSSRQTSPRIGGEGVRWGSALPFSTRLGLLPGSEEGRGQGRQTPSIKTNYIVNTIPRTVVGRTRRDMDMIVI